MIMKISGLILIIALLWGCRPVREYVIRGNITDYSGKAFLLSPGITDALDTLNRAEVKDGSFQMKGMVDAPKFAWIVLENSKWKVPVYLENESFSLQLDPEHPNNHELSGGRLQTLYNRYREIEKSYIVEQDSLKQEWRVADEQDELFKKFHIRALLVKSDSAREKSENEFIRANNNSLVASGIVYQRLRWLSRKKMLRDKYELLGDTARATVLGKILSDNLQREADTRVGAVAPDFTLETPEGKSLSLHSVKAKVKILDFWASWCGPCRAENPHLKNLYEKYRDEGLEIISVSLDNKKERWTKAIKEDGLPWIHLSDLRGWDCAAAKLYGVRAIPHLIVLDKNNRILGTKLRGEALDKCVTEALR